MPVAAHNGNWAEAELKLLIQNPQEEHRLTLVSLMDDQGRRISTGGSSSSHGEYSYDLGKLEDAWSMDVTVAYHRSIFVEFLAKPQAAEPAKQ